MEELKVKPNKYMDLITKVSIQKDINEQENITKASRKGRKVKDTPKTRLTL